MVVLFAWAIHENNLTRYVRNGKHLHGVVSDKDKRVESSGKGGSSTTHLVFVTYHYDGVEQSLLTSDYITESQWNSLSEGDSVTLIYQPYSMYVTDSGEIWFQDEPILEVAFQPALNRLRWYPAIAMFLFLLGVFPALRRIFRRRKPSGGTGA